MSRRKHRQADGGAGDRIASLKATRAELAATYGLPETDPRIGQASIVLLNQRCWEGSILLGRAVPSGELEAYTAVIERLLGPPRTKLLVEFVERDPDPSLLSDNELQEFERLSAKCRGLPAPAVEPLPSDRVLGPSEIAAMTLGKWIDEHSADWSQRALTEAEAIELRNGFQLMAHGFIARNLWDGVNKDGAPPPLPPSATPPPSSEATPSPSPAANVVPLKPAKSDHGFAPWRDITGTGRTMEQGPPYTPPRPFRCYGDIPDGF